MAFIKSKEIRTEQINLPKLDGNLSRPFVPFQSSKANPMTPRKRFPYYDSDLRTMAESLLLTFPEELTIFRTYKIYCVDQLRGMSYTSQGFITIPLWAIRRPKGPGYVTYYLSHELSHVFNYEHGTGRNHDAGFMKWFKRICPEPFQHFETGYKPQAAQAAGIASKKQDDLLRRFQK